MSILSKLATKFLSNAFYRLRRIFEPFTTEEKKLMEFAISDATFGGNNVDKRKLQNIEAAAKQVLKSAKESHEFKLELSHQLHQIVQRGEKNAGQMHDPEKHGPSTSDGIRAEDLSIQEVEEELNKLFSFCQHKIKERKSLSILEKVCVAAYFIHRYLDIHPYGDGNGRVARLLTSLLLIQMGAVSSLLKFDKPVDSRERYIKGLLQTQVTGPESENLQILVDLIKEATMAEDGQSSIAQTAGCRATASAAWIRDAPQICLCT